MVLSDNNKDQSIDEGFNSVDMIMHHIADSHEWHLWGEGESSFTIPLPVILYTNGHLDLFMSSKFNHGHSNVTKGDRVYSIDSHSHIKELNGFPLVDLSITKNTASLFISLVLLLLIFGSVGRKSIKNQGAPKGLASFIEPLVVFVRDDIVKPNVGKNSTKYLPYLLTLFFFILVNNLLGLLPGGANVTGNMAITLILAFITLVVTNISGNKNYWSHIFKPPGVPLLLMPIMIPIEFVGIFTKPIALMIRLFANISAGHIVLMSLIALMFIFKNWLGSSLSFLLAFSISIIEILVAVLQAYIFTVLSALYFGFASEENNH